MIRPPWTIPKKGFPKANQKERALAEWRRTDLRESEGAAKPTSKQISTVVPNVLKQINLDKKQSDLEILKVWNNLLDPNVTAHAQPANLVRGTLFVNVDNSAWLNEIVRYRRREILSRLQTAFGPDLIQKNLISRWLTAHPNMNTTRRTFLKSAALTAAAIPFASAAEAKPQPTFITGKSKMKLGTVTYNIAKDWDVPTIIKNCTETKFEGVELRTGHKHAVEVNLTKDQRAEVKKRFADSPVELMGLGSAFDYHTPDQQKLRADIAATKEYIVLAHDVGASGVKVRPNAFPKGVSKEKTLEQIGKSLRELGEFAAQHGQQIRLEVHGAETQFPPHIKTIMDVADHKNVGVCWNSNQADLDGEGFDHNFNLLKNKIFTVHMRDLYLDEYPFRKLLTGLNEIGFDGYCLAEIPESNDPLRVMRYFRSLWLVYQGLL